METEKLYYADPFLTDFTATVLDCQPGKNGYLVTLDRTAFYPEGGGQPADHGVLDGAVVTDVHEKNSVILHNVDRAVEIGGRGGLGPPFRPYAAALRRAHLFRADL